jgi:rubredoxin
MSAAGVENPTGKPDFPEPCSRPTVPWSGPPARASTENLVSKLFEEVSVKRYMCLVCGLIYDEEQGWPEEGIAPGTSWDEVPANWLCPDCGAGKEDFEMVEI